MDGSSKDSRSQRSKRRTDKQHSKRGRGAGSSTTTHKRMTIIPQQQRNSLQEDEDEAIEEQAMSSTQQELGQDYVEAVKESETHSGLEKMRLASEASWGNISSSSAADCGIVGKSLLKLPMAMRLLLPETSPDFQLFQTPQQSSKQEEHKQETNQQPLLQQQKQKDQEVEDQMDELLKL